MLTLYHWEGYFYKKFTRGRGLLSDLFISAQIIPAKNGRGNKKEFWPKFYTVGILIKALTHEQYDDASILGNVENIFLHILVMLLCVVVWCGTNQAFISHVGTKLFLNVVGCTLVPGMSQYNAIQVTCVMVRQGAILSSTGLITSNRIKNHVVGHLHLKGGLYFWSKLFILILN